VRSSEIAEFSNSRQVFKDLVEATLQGDYSLANNGIEKGLLGPQTIHGSASVFPVCLKSTPLGEGPSHEVIPSQSHTDYMQGRTTTWASLLFKLLQPRSVCMDESVGTKVHGIYRTHV